MGMAYREGLVVLLYSYPAALCAVLFISNLMGYGTSPMYLRFLKKRRGSEFMLRVMWHLQTAFSIAIVCKTNGW